MSSSRRAVHSPKAPKPQGTYSHGVRSGNTIYVGGCMGEDPGSQEIVSGGIQPQTNRAIMNIKAVLEAADSSLDKVISRRIYLMNMKDLKVVDRIWGRYLLAPYPASTCIQVAALAKEGALVEFEVVAEGQQ